MIRTECVQTWGFEHAVRGMRNPMNSWEKSDSYYGCELRGTCNGCLIANIACKNLNKSYIIGANDLALMQKLFKGGSEHRKYLRQIFVSMDIVAPLYWWKEFDTYKVGTVANSCSTMHKIHTKPIEFDDFSFESLNEELDTNNAFHEALNHLIYALNKARRKYLETNDKRYWYQMIQLLPSSYNQRRTITMNYENVVSMINQRENHKLTEWITFTDILKSLPYIKEIIND